ncbi:galactose-3-O-sulfotransferase 2-like [Littorina saxatilis]|uniref:Galactose-3-O-sulfotransferase 2-like n=1 Tax=Littorina saxatilis TaxID=31220 RepID=A0AAN9G0S7_9CAEN
MTSVWRWLCHHRAPVSRLLLVFLTLYVTTLLLFHMPSLVRRGASVTLPDDVSVDDVISGLWNYDPGPLQYLPRSCRPLRDVAFIKCMKCATETLGTVFRRYAYLRNLTVLLPREKKIYLGWPYQMTPLDYQPTSLHGDRFNLLMEHAIYNGSFMRRVMNPGTAFVTMIREPLDHFVSTLNYFNVFEIANVSTRHGMKAVQTYLRNIEYYEQVYKSSAASTKRYCIPDGFSVTKNLLSHCLGMPLGFPEGSADISDNVDAVGRYIRAVDSEFLLVMIMEYFEESLVLLKRMMCWGTKDIIYHSTNSGSYRKNISWHLLTPHDRQLHKEWSKVDYIVYRHFNRTFWAKVRQQGEDFALEVQHFKRVQKQVTWFCNTVIAYGDSYIRIPESPWSPAFNFSSSDCQLMAAPLLVMLQQQHKQREPNLKAVNFSGHPRKLKPLC